MSEIQNEQENNVDIKNIKDKTTNFLICQSIICMIFVLFVFVVELRGGNIYTYSKDLFN